jgi:hypothetical protein
MKFAIPLVAITVLSLFGSTACAATSASQAAWVSALIAKFEAEPVANPPHRIVRFRYRDQMVYYVPPSCCDRPSVLYDAKGEVMCAPEGGMTGRGDGRCADFYQQRSDEWLVWSDARTR